jgi:hypothetical protein
MTAGCTTTKVGSDLPCPSKPVLLGFTIEEIGTMTPVIAEKIATNQINLKAYSEKLEVRAGCDDNSST